MSKELGIYKVIVNFSNNWLPTIKHTIARDCVTAAENIVMKYGSAHNVIKNVTVELVRKIYIE